MGSQDVEMVSRGERSRQLSAALVSIIRQQVGRGPVSCRVTIDGDLVVAVLHDSLTKAEQLLVEHEHEAEVLALRRAIQVVLRPAMIEAVERVMGRRVLTFMSTNHAEPDRSAEIFLLEARPPAA